MPRYGFDYGPRSPQGPQRRPEMPYRDSAGGYGAGWRGGPGRPQGRGWGSDRARAYDLPADWDFDRSPGMRGYRTGRPWGGHSDADEVRARDIMTENPETVTPDTSLVEVARRMRELDVGVIPVVAGAEDGTLRGVVTDRDIVVRAAAEGKDLSKTTAGDCMTESLETVRTGDPVREVFTVMKREQVRRVPVVDDQGRLVGIIAQADLAVDYAGLDATREREVEEVLERVSEPGDPRRRRMRSRGPAYSSEPAWQSGARELGDRLVDGFQTLRREARDLINQQRYDRGWR